MTCGDVPFLVDPDFSSVLMDLLPTHPGGLTEGRESPRHLPCGRVPCAHQSSFQCSFRCLLRNSNCITLYCYKLLVLAINNSPLYSTLLIGRHLHIWHGMVLFFGQAFEEGYVETINPHTQVGLLLGPGGEVTELEVME